MLFTPLVKTKFLQTQTFLEFDVKKINKFPSYLVCSVTMATMITNTGW